MTDPTAVPVASPPPAPGAGLAIAGIIIDFFISPLGLILSIIAKVQAKKAGVRSPAATVGIVLGIVFLVIGVVVTISLVAVFSGIASECAQLGPGVHHIGATTYTCGS